MRRRLEIAPYVVGDDVTAQEIRELWRKLRDMFPGEPYGDFDLVRPGKGRPKTKRKCIVCGYEFEVIRHMNTKTCSSVCANKRHREKVNEWKKRRTKTEQGESP